MPMNFFHGFRVIVSSAVPKDKIIFTDKSTAVVAKINYPSLVYRTTENFMDAVNSIKQFYFAEIDREVEQLKRQPIPN